MDTRKNEWNKFLAGFEEPSGVIPAGSLKALRQAFDAGFDAGILTIDGSTVYTDDDDTDDDVGCD